MDGFLKYSNICYYVVFIRFFGSTSNHMLTLCNLHTINSALCLCMHASVFVCSVIHQLFAYVTSINGIRIYKICIFIQLLKIISNTLVKVMPELMHA